MERNSQLGRGHGVRNERAEEYFTWKSDRTAKDFVKYIKNVRGVVKLSHSGILKDAGISAALARSNPTIKQDLLAIEHQLQDLGLLPEPQLDEIDIANAMPDQPLDNTISRLKKSSWDKKRIEKLERQLATVEIERDELKEALNRYGKLEEYLSDTMRLPR